MDYCNFLISRNRTFEAIEDSSKFVTITLGSSNVKFGIDSGFLINRDLKKSTFLVKEQFVDQLH